MPSSQPTDPATSVPERTGRSEGTPDDAKERIGSSEEVLSLVDALKSGTTDRLDHAQEKAAQLAREIDAVLRNPDVPVLAKNAAENGTNGNNITFAAVQQSAVGLNELQQRFDALVVEHAAMRRERDELAGRLAATTSPSQEPKPQNDEMEKALLSIRQARDTVLARNVILTEKLTAAENRIAELEYELESAERARETALTSSQDLSLTCDELRKKTLELTLERDQLREQATRATEPPSDGRAAENAEDSNDTAGEPAQISLPELPVASDAAIALAAMQSCLKLLGTDPENSEILSELGQHFRNFGERARADGCAALERLSVACEQLTDWLRKAPDKVAESLDPLANAISVLSEIAAMDHSERVPDPTGGLVYVVDDDVNNCEGITMAMEKMALKMRYAVTSEIALNELTAGPCDLIILDMDLSGMNGFRLFTLVRAIGHHEKTPVIFLSEMTGNKARVAEPRGNAHAFVSKPCDLNTLGLISLCMILKARLAALGTAPASGDESSA